LAETVKKLSLVLDWFKRFLPSFFSSLYS
jgi:hypothetical protein